MHVIMCVCVTRLTADIPPLAGLPIPACMHRHDNTWNYMSAGMVETIPCDAQVMVTCTTLLSTKSTATVHFRSCISRLAQMVG